MKKTSLFITILSTAILFQSTSYSSSYDYNKCYNEALTFVNTSSDKQTSDSDIQIRIEGIGREKYYNPNKKFKCIFEVKKESSGDNETLSFKLELFNNGNLKGGKNTYLSNFSETEAEQYYLFCKNKNNVLDLVSTITQKGGWRKTFENKIYIEKNKNGSISKVKMDTDGPFNTAGEIVCNF